MGTLQGPTDDDVVERVRRGDTALYEVLMRRYNQRLFRVARAILGRDSDAEDAVQDAYVQAYLHLDQYRGEAAFSTWLTRIVIRQALAVRRREERREAKAEVQSMRAQDAGRTPEDEAMRHELAALIEGAVDRLPRTYRVVFVMREIENLSTSETAEALEISEENVKVRLHRSRAMLRRELYEHAGTALQRAYAFENKRCDRIVARVFATLAGMHVSQQRG